MQPPVSRVALVHYDCSPERADGMKSRNNHLIPNLSRLSYPEISILCTTRNPKRVQWRWILYGTLCHGL